MFMQLYVIMSEKSFCIWVFKVVFVYLSVLVVQFCEMC